MLSQKTKKTKAFSYIFPKFIIFIFLFDIQFVKLYNYNMEYEIMEKIEIEEGFDNFEEEFDEFEEEESCLNEIILSPKNFDWVVEETLVFIVKTKSNNLFSNLENVRICGKHLIDWSSMAFAGCKIIVTEFENEEKLLSEIKSKAKDFPFVYIGYNDTPLFEKKTFFSIMDYFSVNNLNSLALERGFVFKTEFLPQINHLSSLISKKFNKDDFVIVDKPENFVLANKVLSEKILDFHQRNEVVILSRENINIDADVKIAKGVIIHSNNTIKGKTVIEEGVILEEGNFIIDSIIESQSPLIKTQISNSKIGKTRKVMPFSIFESENLL